MKTGSVVSASLLMIGVGCAIGADGETIGAAPELSSEMAPLCPEPSLECPEDLGSLVPAIADGVVDNRGLPFYAAHPFRTCAVQRSGARIALPYHAYDLDALIVHGTADAGDVSRALRGTGYIPVLTEHGRAFMAIWMLDYHDTSVGPYREFAISFAVTPSDAPKHVDIGDNPFRVLLPSLDPTNAVYSYALIVDDGVALEAGRQNSGLDKRFGTMSYADCDQRRTFVVRDDSGHPIVLGGVAQDLPSVFAQLPMFAAALGLTVEQLALLPTTSQSLLVNRDVEGEPNDVLHTDLHVRFGAPLYQLVEPSDSIASGGDTELGAFLRRLHFRPLVSFRDPHFGMAVDLPREDLESSP